jgi:hypothetical protein
MEPNIVFTIDLKNSQEFINALYRFPGDIDKAIYEALNETMDNILRRAKQNAPVDTGRLRADIKEKVNQRELKGVIWNDVEYAIYVHEGHKTKSKYILRAIYDNQKAIQDRMQKKLELLTKRGLI